jgi:hypothetical protein
VARSERRRHGKRAGLARVDRVGRERRRAHDDLVARRQAGGGDVADDRVGAVAERDPVGREAVQRGEPFDQIRLAPRVAVQLVEVGGDRAARRRERAERALVAREAQHAV